MFLLADEKRLRSALGLPEARLLWGATSICAWEGKHECKRLAAQVAEEPERTASALGFNGLERLHLAEHLAAHGLFSCAADFLAFLAVSPGSEVRKAPTKPSLELARAVFFRHKAVMAWLQGGFYNRAHAVLNECEGLIVRLGNDTISRIQRANTNLLWARLFQLTQRTKQSDRKAAEAEALFVKAGSSFSGLNLLRIRNRLTTDSEGVVSQLAKTPSSRSNREAADGLYGPFASHYRLYLLARLALYQEAWETAEEKFKEARQALDECTHGRHINQIRVGYTTMGLGRAKVGHGLAAGDRSEFAAGLTLLLTARWAFRGIAFAPGEYVAYQQFLRAKRENGDASSVSELKESYRLGRRTEVRVYQLESGLTYAKALEPDGRPNAADRVANELRDLSENDATEISSKQRRAIIELQGRTKNARINGVEPLELWGVSKYAEREREFVAQPRNAYELIAIEGPSGSGRRYLAERIASARQQTHVPVIDAIRAPKAETLSSLKIHFEKPLPVILSNFNLWDRDLQSQVLSHIRTVPDAASRMYFTIRPPLHPHDLVGELKQLVDSPWPVEPLSQRPQDMPLLARGFCVRYLLSQPAKLRGASPIELILTGQACRLVRETFESMGQMSRVMRSVAAHLQFDRDIVREPDGRLRLLAEAILKHLRTGEHSRLTATLSRMRPPHNSPWPSREELLSAPDSLIEELVTRSNRKLSAVAEACRVPRVLLFREWSRSGRMKTWHRYGGRTTSPRGSFTLDGAPRAQQEA